MAQQTVHSEMSSLSGLGLLSLLKRRLLTPRLRQIRLLVCDVDGVLTDGGLLYDEHGRVLKRFDVRDGLAIRMLERSFEAGCVTAQAGGRWGGGARRDARVGTCLMSGAVLNY